MTLTSSTTWPTSTPAHSPLGVTNFVPFVIRHYGHLSRGSCARPSLPEADSTVAVKWGDGPRPATVRYVDGVFAGYALRVDGTEILLSTATPVVLSTD